MEKKLKKWTAVLVLAIGMITAAGCGSAAQSQPAAGTVASAGQNAEQEKGVPVILTINGQPFKAHLNQSKAAQSLRKLLPKTVVLNDSDNDFCGDALSLEYDPSEVQKGYKNGDLAFWTPASNFVIFRSGEEKSGETGNLVILGHMDEPQSKLDALHGQLKVEIAEER